MRTRRILRLALLFTAAGAAGVLVLPGVARARTAAEIPLPGAGQGATHQPTNKTQRGMGIVGIDTEVAVAHGYRVVTYPDGSLQSVPSDPNDKSKTASPIVPATASLNPIPGTASPALAIDTVYGNCGWSFIEADQYAPHTIWMRSGFTVTPAPIASFNWLVSLSDNNGHSYQGARGGPQGGMSWNRLWNPLTQYGGSLEWVEPDYSYAILDNGDVCASGEPFIALTVSP